MSTPNTVALTYNGYVTQIGILAALQTTTIGNVTQGVDQYFNGLIPQMINYAELRIQRDLDLLQSLVENSTYSLTPAVNNVAIDVNNFVALRTVTYIVGATHDPLLPVSKEFLQNVYGDTSYTAPPQFYAMIGADNDLTGNVSTSIAVGPAPDEAYPLVIRGTQRLPSLNSLNSDPSASTLFTWISANLPDMMLMASMIYLSGFQRNFGRQSDDPTMAVSYEQQYGALLKGASTEEARKKFQASAWTSLSVPTTATATR